MSARRAARAQPAARMLPGGAAKHVDAASDIVTFGVLRLIRRQSALAPAMRRHHMSARGDRRRQVGIALGDHAAGVEHRPRVLAIQQIEQPPGTDLRAVFCPGQRLQIGHTRLQRIAHRADAGGAALGPAFQHHVHRYRQWLVGGPTGRSSARHEVASLFRLCAADFGAKCEVGQRPWPFGWPRWRKS